VLMLSLYGYILITIIQRIIIAPKLKMDTILQSLQFKIPSINQGLKLTNALNTILNRLNIRMNSMNIWNRLNIKT